MPLRFWRREEPAPEPPQDGPLFDPPENSSEAEPQGPLEERIPEPYIPGRPLGEPDAHSLWPHAQGDRGVQDPMVPPWEPGAVPVTPTAPVVPAPAHQEGPPTEPVPAVDGLPMFTNAPLPGRAREETELERIRSLHRRASPSHSGATRLSIPRGELGREPRLTSAPALSPEDQAHITAADQAQTEKEEEMSQIDTHISELLAIDGATGAAVVDISSGMALATGGAPGFDLTVAAAGNSNVVRAKLATMKDLGLAGKIEDIMITLDGHYHIVSVLNSSDTDGLFIYLVLDRAKANLALARHKMTRIAATVSV